ncbi:MAG: hypothetical protein U1F77_18265 [Kiritimatiellia bacterium]
MAQHLAEAVVRKVPAGAEVLLLQWRSGLTGRRTAALEGQPRAAGLRLSPTPAGRGAERDGRRKIRITMEEGRATCNS